MWLANSISRKEKMSIFFLFSMFSFGLFFCRVKKIKTTKKNGILLLVLYTVLLTFARRGICIHVIIIIFLTCDVLSPNSFLWFPSFPRSIFIVLFSGVVFGNVIFFILASFMETNATKFIHILTKTVFLFDQLRATPSSFFFLFFCIKGLSNVRAKSRD